MSGIGIGLAIGSARRSRRPAEYRFAAPVLPAGATLTRGSGGSHRDAEGRIAWAGPTVPRIEHAPASGGWAPIGVLVEPGATNLLRRSAPIDGPDWTLFGEAAMLGACAAPDGSTQARRLRMSGGGGIYAWIEGLTPGTVHTISLWVRAADSDGATFIQIVTSNGSVWNSGVATRFAIDPAWRRVTMSGTVAEGDGGVLAIGSTDVAGNFDPQCVGDVEIWGAQLETGAQATSLIHTAGAVATRAADALTLDWARTGLADGTHSVRYRFDDGSTQVVPTQVTGGTATVPVPLARTVLRSATAG